MPNKTSVQGLGMVSDIKAVLYRKEKLAIIDRSCEIGLVVTLSVVSSYLAPIYSMLDNTYFHIFL